MSVLFLRRRQQSELAHDWSACDNGCVTYISGTSKRDKRSKSHHGRTSATWEAELMGVHAAWLCEGCKEAWRAGWPGAGGGVPVVDGRRDSRAFEEQEAA